MRPTFHSLFVATALTVAWLFAATAARAAELQFVTADMPESMAIWHPSTAMIDQTEIAAGSLTFVLKNLTSSEHIFAAPGLYEVVWQSGRQQVDPGVDIETMEHVLRPLKVTVGPKETKRVRISSRNLLGRSAIGKRFRFFCPIHQDKHLGGSIFVTE
jgi:hypothetical protein